MYIYAIQHVLLLSRFTVALRGNESHCLKVAPEIQLSLEWNDHRSQNLVTVDNTTRGQGSNPRGGNIYETVFGVYRLFVIA